MQHSRGINNFALSSNRSIVNTNGEGGGNIKIQANQAVLTDKSLILANTLGTQNGGGVIVYISELDISGSSVIESSTYGAGNAGNLVIHAGDSINITGKNSYLGSVVTESAMGNGGDVTIKSKKVVARSGGQVLMNTAGKGSVGNLTLNVSDSVELFGTSEDGINSSALFARAQQGAKGNAGDITINTGYLLVQDGAQVSTRSRGMGQAGDLTINASNSVNLVGTLAGTDMRSRLIAAGFSSSKKGGNITINTKQLRVKNGAIAVTSTFGEGSAGQLTINASDTVELIGISTDGRYRSSLNSETSGSGNAANLVINTRQLTVQDGAAALTSTFSVGQAGKLIINAIELVDLSGVSSNGTFRSGLGAETFDVGNAGTLKITSEKINIRNGAIVSALTKKQGRGGDIEIKTNSLNIDNSGSITSRSDGQGRAGNIDINVRNVFQSINGEIATSAIQSSGGTISISANSVRLFENSDIKTNVASDIGSGGNITRIPSIPRGKHYSSCQD
jgi:large exoprotein involved in heme utilization and adhesion